MAVSQSRHDRFDTLKRLAQAAIWGFHKIGRDREEICEELTRSRDHLTKRVHAAIHEVHDGTESKYHGNTFFEMAEFILWVYDNDLAYHDQGNYVVAKLLLDADAILPHIKDKLEPESWSINKWWRRKAAVTFADGAK